MRAHGRPALGILLLLGILGWALGCRQEVPPLFRRNQPPETTLTVVPEDSTAGFYSYRVYWRGEDTDGRVVRYLFAITDTLSRDEEQNWDPLLANDRELGIFTTKTDSVFVFDSRSGRQSFNIVAIDDFGAFDRTPARAFFRVVDNGRPRVVFLDVQQVPAAGQPLAPPCVATEPCTIPSFTSFKVRFTGATLNNRITGLQWHRLQPESENPQPFGAESLFVQPQPMGQDTTAFGIEGDTLWTVQGDTVTLYYKSTREAPIESGRFLLQARVRDEANQRSFTDLGQRVVIVNHDPDTRLQHIQASTCPRCAQSNPPAYCATMDSIRVGWVVGLEGTNFPSQSDWIQFCEGDTIPQLSRVRFYARGQDDPRDLPIDPQAGLREVGYSYRFTWTTYDVNRKNLNMQFSSEFAVRDTMLPDGTPWRGGLHGWNRLCPFDFTFHASAVDEHGRIDGTPDTLRFFVSGEPKLDSLQLKRALVFIPKCPSGFESFCPNLATLPPFGPDTLIVVGEHIPDNSGQTPIGLGFNKFVFPFRTWAHDHPRDRIALYSAAERGRIRSWQFSFDCITPPGAPLCPDLTFPGESAPFPTRGWVEDEQILDPPGQQVFDNQFQVTFPLDTLCVGPSSNPCSQLRATVRDERFGQYRFLIQGRDTSASSQPCSEPEDLSLGAATLQRLISNLGRFTKIDTAFVSWLPIHQVRSYKVGPSVEKPESYRESSR